VVDQEAEVHRTWRMPTAEATAVDLLMSANQYALSVLGPKIGSMALTGFDSQRSICQRRCDNCWTIRS
jgi:hypothetical protein